MARVLAHAGIRAFVFFAVIGGVLGQESSATTAAGVDRSSPGAAVKSFYAWYMKHEWVDEVSATKPFFTPSLYTNVAISVRDERCLNEAWIDYDPWNGSQVGTASYTVGSAKIRGSAATVPVLPMLMMGPGRKAFRGSPVTIALVHGAAGWLIDDAASSGSSLKKELLSQIAALSKDLANPSSPQYPTASQRACLKKPIP